MGTRQGLVCIGQRVVACLAVLLLIFGTGSCAKPTEPTQLMSEPTVEPNRLAGQLAEVSPPEAIQLLKQVIDAYTPQVRILSPRPGEIVEDTSISLRVQVRGLPLFKNATWGLGPHLHVFLDNEPYKAVYDLSEPLEFKDLSPGTHTLRVFASRPWHESFKNQGAFDQRTFHIYAPTPQDELSAEKPLLTYSRPQGSYGAEPIMLDFYLTNAPLHMTAQEDPGDDIHDWRIRCTINGQSFVFDQWQPLYLKGFQPGRNWVQLELIDESGRPIENRFNNTVRVIDYEPGGADTLSKLVRGELDVKAVAGIIDPTYVPPAKPEPEPAELPGTEDELPADPETTTDQKAAPTVQPPGPTQGVPPGAPKPAPTPVPQPSVPPEVPVAPQEKAPGADKPDGKKQTTPVNPVEPGDAATELNLPPSQQPEETLNPQEVPVVPEVSPADVQPNATVDQKSAAQGQAASADRGTAPPPVRAKDEAQIETGEDEPVGPTKSVQAADTASQDEAVEPSTGNKLLERYKQWQQRRSKSLQEAEPLPRELSPDAVDVYLAPTPEANRPSGDSSIEENGDDSEMDRPDLVEPYLTAPYLTEPRLDLLPSNEDPGNEDPDDPSPQASGGNSATQEPVNANPERPFI